MSDEPRAYTEEEVRERFLDHVRSMVDWWTDVQDRTERRKLEGLAFSILAALDGSSMALPAFKVIPDPHPDDAEYRRDEGENWFPVDCDIAGPLHELFYKKD